MLSIVVEGQAFPHEQYVDGQPLWRGKVRVARLGACNLRGWRGRAGSVYETREECWKPVIDQLLPLCRQQYTVYGRSSPSATNQKILQTINSGLSQYHEGGAVICGMNVCLSWPGYEAGRLIGACQIDNLILANPALIAQFLLAPSTPHTPWT